MTNEDRLDLDEIRAKRKKAGEVVSNMCSGDGKWLMQIPANPKQDSDILISDALNQIEKLISEVERLRSETERLQSAHNNNMKLRYSSENHLKEKIQSLQTELDGMWEIRRKDGVVSQERANEIQSLQAELERSKEAYNKWKSNFLKEKQELKEELEQVKGELSIAQNLTKFKFRGEQDKEIKKEISDLKQKLEASEKRCGELEEVKTTNVICQGVNRELKDEIKSLKCSLDDKRKNYDGLMNQLRDMSDKHTQVEKELLERIKHSRTLSHKNTELEEDIDLVMDYDSNLLDHLRRNKAFKKHIDQYTDEERIGKMEDD